MRRSDIVELLDEVESQVALIECEYIKARTNKEIKEILKIKVKSSMEHLRSCLDYSAHDIYDNIYQPTDGKTKEERKKMKIYFPYGKTSNDLKSSLGKNFKNLKIKSRPTYELIESVQQYKCSKSWLPNLCEINNNIKHNELIKQNRSDSKNLQMNGVNMFSMPSNASGINIVMKGNTINGIKQEGDIVFENGEFKTDLDVCGWDIQLINWTTFTFNNTNIEVLDLLKTSLSNIRKFMNDLYLIIV